jgi:hypothetical protein
LVKEMVRADLELVRRGYIIKSTLWPCLSYALQGPLEYFLRQSWDDYDSWLLEFMVASLESSGLFNWTK